MKHQVKAPRIVEEQCVTSLTQKVSAIVPSDQKITHVRAPGVTPGYSIDISNFLCQDELLLRISCTLAPARVCCVSNAYEANQIIEVAPMGSEEVQIIQAPIQIGCGLAPNVIIQLIYMGHKDSQYKIYIYETSE